MKAGGLGCRHDCELSEIHDDKINFGYLMSDETFDSGLYTYKIYIFRCKKCGKQFRIRQVDILKRIINTRKEYKSINKYGNNIVLAKQLEYLNSHIKGMYLVSNNRKHYYCGCIIAKCLWYYYNKYGIQLNEINLELKKLDKDG